MKILIGSIIGIAGSVGIVFLDIKLVKWIFAMVPINEWTKLIKLIIVFFDVWFTAGICLLPFAIGLGIGAILEQK